MERSTGKWVIIAGLFLIGLSISSLFIFTKGVRIVQVGRYFDGTDETQGGVAGDVLIKNNIAYLVDGPDGLEILNISDPSNIQELGQLENDAGSLNPRKVFISGDVAYLTVQNNGLKLIDISDPSIPSQIGLYDNNCSILDVFVSRDVAYVAAKENGVEILNISNPSNIVKIGNYTDNYNVSMSIDFDEQQNLLYVADCSDGLEILNVSNPNSPVELGQLKMSRAMEIDVVENYAYITLYESGLSIVNVSDPANPLEISRFEYGFIMDVFVNDTYAYLTSDNGLLMLDVSDPANPVMESVYSHSIGSYGVFINENLIYYANGFYGLEVLQIKPTNLNYILMGAFIIPGLIMIYIGVKLLVKMNKEQNRMKRIVDNI